MTAIATLEPELPPSSNAKPYASGADPQPVVLINAVPEPRLVVRQHRIDGPLDRRQTTLSIAAAAQDPPRDALLSRWADAHAALAVPLRLTDDQTRWVVLLQGQVNTESVDRSIRSDDKQLTLIDHWNVTLDTSIASVWWQTSDGLLYDDTRPATMQIGDRANRSTLTWPIAGQTVHVFQEAGQPWTIATALASLNALANLDLSLDLIPTDVGDQPLSQTIDLSRPIDDALERILDPAGLIIQRDLSRHGHRITERRAVRPIRQGRRVHLAWADDDRPLGDVLRIDADRPTPAAQQWIVQADGWVVESTFTLAHGWDPALEGEPDTTYSQTSNPNFATYANVYRLWVLNEDAHFTPAPFNQGDPFDLTTFFNEGLDPAQQVSPIRPRPLRFGDNLTFDDAGNRRAPLVQFSTDSGQTWSDYPGQALIRNDRAAVYLDDADLPASFLTAAQAGTAMLRVTATLASPVAVQASRWAGNPFAGSLPPRRFELGDTFRFQRVAPDSIHFADLTAGTLTAQQSDQTQALNDWLITQITRTSAGASDTDAGRATLTLAGIHPTLRLGDHLINPAGPGQTPTGHAQAITAAAAEVTSTPPTTPTVTGITHQWSNPIAPADRSTPTGRTSAPQTRVQLAF